MANYKILTIGAPGTRLEAAEYLPEYDAIILDPPAALFHVPAGTETTWSPSQFEEFVRVEQEHEKRANELVTFFERGGVLVAHLVEPSQLMCDGGRAGWRMLDSYNWWFRPTFWAIGRFKATLPEPASGSALTLTEPGHPFEEYLRFVDGYKTWLKLPDGEDGLVVLAENRAAKPVAVEIACYLGAAVLVPPPTSDGAKNLLQAALWQLLNSRVALREDWPVAEERRLLEERQQVLSEMRVKRDQIDKRLTDIRDFKAGVMKKVHVERAIGYMTKAARTPTPKNSIPSIWNMLEMLRDHYTNGLAEIAKLLRVPKADLEFLHYIANQKDLDLRHATAGQPRAVSPQELQRVLDVGKAIVQGTIDYECTSATGRVTIDEAVAGAPTVGSRAENRVR